MPRGGLLATLTRPQPPRAQAQLERWRQGRIESRPTPGHGLPALASLTLATAGTALELLHPLGVGAATILAAGLAPLAAALGARAVRGGVRALLTVPATLPLAIFVGSCVAFALAPGAPQGGLGPSGAVGAVAGAYAALLVGALRSRREARVRANAEAALEDARRDLVRTDGPDLVLFVWSSWPQDDWALVRLDLWRAPVRARLATLCRHDSLSPLGYAWPRRSPVQAFVEGELPQEQADHLLRLASARRLLSKPGRPVPGQPCALHLLRRDGAEFQATLDLVGLNKGERAEPAPALAQAVLEAVVQLTSEARALRSRAKYIRSRSVQKGPPSPRSRRYISLAQR